MTLLSCYLFIAVSSAVAFENSGFTPRSFYSGPYRQYLSKYDHGQNAGYRQYPSRFDFNEIYSQDETGYDSGYERDYKQYRSRNGRNVGLRRIRPRFHLEHSDGYRQKPDGYNYIRVHRRYQPTEQSETYHNWGFDENEDLRQDPPKHDQNEINENRPNLRRENNCSNGKIWGLDEDGCSYCLCLPGGTRSRTICTKELCEADPQVHPGETTVAADVGDCASGALTALSKDGCNQCRCTLDGRISRICTRKRCAEKKATTNSTSL